MEFFRVLEAGCHFLLKMFLTQALQADSLPTELQEVFFFFLCQLTKPRVNFLANPTLGIKLFPFSKTELSVSASFPHSLPTGNTVQQA